MMNLSLPSLSPTECYAFAFAAAQKGETKSHALHKILGEKAKILETGEIGRWTFDLFRYNGETIVGFNGDVCPRNLFDNIALNEKAVIPQIEQQIKSWELKHRLKVSIFIGNEEGGYFADHVFRQKSTFIKRISFNGANSDGNGLHLRSYPHPADSLYSTIVHRFLGFENRERSLEEFEPALKDRTWTDLTEMCKNNPSDNPTICIATPVVQEAYKNPIEWLRGLYKKAAHEKGIEAFKDPHFMDHLLSPLMTREGDMNPYFEQLVGIANAEQGECFEKLLELNPPLTSETSQKVIEEILERDLRHVDLDQLEVGNRGRILREEVRKNLKLIDSMKKMVGAMVRSFAESIAAVQKADETVHQYQKRMKQLAYDRARSYTPIDYVPLQARLQATLTSEHRLYQMLDEVETSRNAIQAKGQEIRSQLAHQHKRIRNGEISLEDLVKLNKNLSRAYKNEMQKVQGAALGVELLIDIAAVVSGTPQLLTLGAEGGDQIRQIGMKGINSHRKRLGHIQEAYEVHHRNVLDANQRANHGRANLEEFVHFIKTNRSDLLPSQYREELRQSCDAIQKEIDLLEAKKAKSVENLDDAKRKLRRYKGDIAVGAKKKSELKPKISKAEGDKDFYEQEVKDYDTEIGNLKTLQDNADQELQWEKKAAPFRDGLATTITAMQKARSSGNAEVDRMQRELLEGRQQYLRERQIDTLPIYELCAATGALSQEIDLLFFANSKNEKTRLVGQKINQAVECLTRCYEIYDMTRYWVEFAGPSLFNIGKVFDANPGTSEMVPTSASTKGNALSAVTGALDTVLSKAGIITYLVPAIQLVSGVLKAVRWFTALFTGEVIKSDTEILHERFDRLEKIIQQGLQSLGKHLDQRFEQVHEHLMHNHKELLKEFTEFRIKQQQETLDIMREIDHLQIGVRRHIDRQTYIQQIVHWQHQMAQFREYPLAKRESRYHAAITNNCDPAYNAYIETLSEDQPPLPTIDLELMALQPAYFTGFIGRAMQWQKPMPQAERYIGLCELFLQDARAIIQMGSLKEKGRELMRITSLLMHQSVPLVQLGRKLGKGITQALKAKQRLLSKLVQLGQRQHELVTGVWKSINSQPLTDEEFWNQRTPLNRFTLRHEYHHLQHWDKYTSSEAKASAVKKDEGRKFEWIEYKSTNHILIRKTGRVYTKAGKDIFKEEWHEYLIRTVIKDDSGIYNYQYGHYGPHYAKIKHLWQKFHGQPASPQTHEPTVYEFDHSIWAKYNIRVRILMRQFSQEIDLFFHEKAISAVRWEEEEFFFKNRRIRVLQNILGQSLFFVPEEEGRIPLAFPRKVYQQMVSTLPRNLLGSLLCNNCIIPTYSFFQDEDKFHLVLRLRDKNGQVLLQKAVAVFDRKTIQYFTEFSFDDGMTKEGNSITYNRTLTLANHGASLPVFLTQMMYTGTLELGLPGKGSSEVTLKDYFTKTETGYNKESKDQSNLIIDPKTMTAPVDHLFPGLWNILFANPDAKLEYDSQTYDEKDPATLQSMLKTSEIELKEIRIEPGEKNPDEIELEKLYEQYKAAYQILMTHGLWSYGISSDDLKQELDAELGLFEPASLEDFYNWAITLPEIDLAEEKTTRSLFAKLEKAGPSKKLAKVKELQKELSLLMDQLKEMIA